jgi:hypothetical protein
VRIGTWNLAGRWTGDHHRDFLLGLDCDVVLLTEVSERLSVPTHHLHLGTAVMAQKRRWAGILSRTPLEPLPDPHPASAMARIGSWTYCSSILPWRAAKDGIWVGDKHAERTGNAVDVLLGALPRTDLVWGGDWNHSMSGPELSGSKAGRTSILEALELLALDVPTAGLGHHIVDYLTIDHIALPNGTPVTSAERHVAEADGRRLSDHDAYVVTCDESGAAEESKQA